MFFEDFRQRSIWLYQPILDFRKQMNSLIQIVAEQMERSPMDGSVYVFRNRKKDKLKLLFWDRNGFWMASKRLEKGHFDFPTHETGSVTLSWEQIYLLISGLPMTKLIRIPTKSITHFT